MNLLLVPGQLNTTTKYTSFFILNISLEILKKDSYNIYIHSPALYTHTHTTVIFVSDNQS